jgi:hypothetical protein
VYSARPWRTREKIATLAMNGGLVPAHALRTSLSDELNQPISAVIFRVTILVFAGIPAPVRVLIFVFVELSFIQFR